MSRCRPCDNQTVRKSDVTHSTESSRELTLRLLLRNDAKRAREISSAKKWLGQMGMATANLRRVQG